VCSPTRRASTLRGVHLRSPSIDHGVASFLWALLFFVIMWLGMLAVGVAGATAFFLSIVSAALIFLFVRVYGQKELRTRRQAR
jgi:hypothetical protein